MQFRVLGPVTAESQGRPVPVSGARQQRMLAALLIDAGRVVPAGRLIDILWDDRPPATAGKQIHNCVVRLRACLLRGGFDRSVILTDGPGYRLNVDEGEVDHVASSRLLGTARRLAADGRLEFAVAAYRAGLALWRGPALAGIGGRIMRAAAARLDEQRLAAVEELIEARLRLGDHREMVDELVGWVAAHPHREGLVGQLMLALHRSGRRSEALEVYHRLRTGLAEELGIDPGGDLQKLYAAVLRGDPRVECPPHSATQRQAEPGASVPAQLPPAPELFVGRDRELARLDELLGVTPGIAVIVGPAGVGKTALALAWAHKAAERYGDGQLFVDLRGFSPRAPLSAEQAVSRVLRDLDVPAERIPLDVDEQSAMYRSLMAGRRMLVLLDNAADIDQIRFLLPGTPGSAVLVTSRHRLSGLAALYDVRRLSLSHLSRAAAVDLIVGVLGARWSTTGRHTAAELAELCNRLPLALRVAAASLRHADAASVADLVARLRSDRLGTLTLDDDHLAVRSAFEQSYMSVPHDVRRLFRLIGAAPGPDIAVPAAAALSGHPPATVLRLLNHLADVHLVEEWAAGRYQMHDLTEVYAIECATRDEPAAEVDTAVDRLLDFYLRTVRAATEVFCPSNSPPPPPVTGVTSLSFHAAEDANRWLERERSVLVAAATHASGERSAWVCTFTQQLMRYFWNRRHCADMIALSHAALAAARYNGDIEQQARTLNFSGVAYWAAGDLDLASQRLNDALAVSEEGPTGCQAAILSNLSGVYRAQGRTGQAMTCMKRAVPLYKRLGNAVGLANSYITLAMIEMGLGQLDCALKRLKLTLESARTIGHADGQASTLNLISDIYRDVGRTDLAAACLRRVLELAPRGLGLANSIYARVGTLTLTAAPTGATLAEILALATEAREAGSVQVEAEVLRAAGEVAHAIGRHREAAEHFSAALALARRSGDRHLHIDALRGLAAARYPIDPTPDRLTELASARTLAVDAGLRLQEGKTLTVEAETALALGIVERAEQAARAALDIHRQTGTVPWQRRCEAVLDRTRTAVLE